MEKGSSTVGNLQEKEPVYRAHIIVFPSPNSMQEWKPPETTTGLQPTEKGALENLLANLQQGVAKMFEKGYTYESESETAIGSDSELKWYSSAMI